ncbi:hypothetical protein Ancab_012346 [Ancistrocladus abbreviatus]
MFDVNLSNPLLQQYNDNGVELMNTGHVSSGRGAFVDDSLICSDVEIEDASYDDVSYLPLNHFSDIASNEEVPAATNMSGSGMVDVVVAGRYEDDDCKAKEEGKDQIS